jgi:site-specific DNA-methyltransferase (cytosine-N4-specific)
MEMKGYSAAYTTVHGAAYCGDSLQLLRALPDQSVQLVITSPPFALQRKKEYGNKEQAEYVAWIAQFAQLVLQKLRDDGSFVIDLGGAYQKVSPLGPSTIFVCSFISAT